MGEVVRITPRDALRSFTAMKLAALDAATGDQRLTHLDFRLFWYLASASDQETGVAHRKQTVIADALGVTRRAVQISTGRLAECGYIAILTKDGGTYAHAYEINVRKANASSPFQVEKANTASPLSKKRRTGTPEKANDDAEKGEPSFAPILPFNSLDIPLTARSMPDVVVAALQRRLGDKVFGSWFGKIAVSEIADGVVALLVPNKFIADHISSHFDVELLDAWRIYDPKVDRVVAEATNSRAPP